MSAAENVAYFPPRRVALTMRLDQLDSFEGRRTIARLLREWERSNPANTFTALAKKVNLARETVSKVASETTLYPRLHTILAIMMGLGFQAVRFE